MAVVLKRLLDQSAGNYYFEILQILRESVIIEAFDLCHQQSLEFIRPRSPFRSLSFGWQKYFFRPRLQRVLFAATVAELEWQSQLGQRLSLAVYARGFISKLFKIYHRNRGIQMRCLRNHHSFVFICLTRQFTKVFRSKFAIVPLFTLKLWQFFYFEWEQPLKKDHFPRIFFTYYAYQMD